LNGHAPQATGQRDTDPATGGEKPRRPEVPTTDNGAGAWLSQDAYDRLQAELDHWISQRPVIATEINARREEGDLRENGGYHAAREEQGKMEGRIRYLQELLRVAQVGEAPSADAVAPGTVVTIQFDDDPEDTETFLLGSREIAATTELTVYSPESALGTAILGRRKGDTVSYTAPSGAEITVTVVGMEPFTG
jgi:transcription elongation factor GreA